MFDRAALRDACYGQSKLVFTYRDLGMTFLMFVRPCDLVEHGAAGNRGVEKTFHGAGSRVLRR